MRGHDDVESQVRRQGRLRRRSSRQHRQHQQVERRRQDRERGRGEDERPQRSTQIAHAKPHAAENRESQLTLHLPRLVDAIAEQILDDGGGDTQQYACQHASDQQQAQIWRLRFPRHLSGLDHRVSVLEGRFRDRELDARAVGALQNALQLTQLGPQTKVRELRDLDCTRGAGGGESETRARARAPPRSRAARPRAAWRSLDRCRSASAAASASYFVSISSTVVRKATICGDSCWSAVTFCCAFCTLGCVAV